MPISIEDLVGEIQPDRTVLFLGAGAAYPSGAPSSSDLIDLISTRFGIANSALRLTEIAGLAEGRRNRAELVSSVRDRILGLKAKGAILNLPLYDWKAIYTTNYDELIEDAYERAGRQLAVYSSNFDFVVHGNPQATRLFKLHGTIGKDVSRGDAARLIITEQDYDLTTEYREALYDRLAADLSPGTQLLVIGHSLSDRDVQDQIQRAKAIQQKAASGGKIVVLLYEPDMDRASLLEARGLKVCFASLDLFSEAVAKKESLVCHADTSSDFLSSWPILRPTTLVVEEEMLVDGAGVSRVFNGWPASYADIAKGFTFDRVVATEAVDRITKQAALCTVILGASGVGKTTCARQAVLKLQKLGYKVWEHKTDHQLSTESWLTVAKKLQNSNLRGVLFVDEAHSHLFELNDLLERLASLGTNSLSILLGSTRNHWGPRVKSPKIYSGGRELHISRLEGAEVDRLLTLVDAVPDLAQLVEVSFGGFSRQERRRRLVDRCEADMFVCMKNIFASEKYDDILLREYATLDPSDQEVYRLVAAMEHSGIRVHRQLVLRVLGISAESVSGILADLADIVTEYSVNERDGIFGWRVRHPVVAEIVSKYKFPDVEALETLFENVIDNIAPTYDIEIRTLRELCNVDSGLSRIPKKETQNRLLRRMMSIAPGERVPRHRLIRNLIDATEFEQAESEIRIFEKDFGRDGPVVRYKILLMIGRAMHTPGLLKEDRVVILEQARNLAADAVGRFGSNKNILGTYCEVGIGLLKLTGNHSVFDAAMDALKEAEQRVGDPDITRMVARYSRRISGQALQGTELA